MHGVTILIIIVCYFSVLMAVSYFTGKKRDNETFFIGGKQSPWFLVAFGMIGTSISGVTFVSVPGMPLSIDMTYMQMVFGFSLGYVVIALFLLPLYYRLNLTSIYTYLDIRFGNSAYKTGASFFFVSKIIGAAARLYVVAFILQRFVFEDWNIPFVITSSIIVFLIWLYSHRSGLKTIVWTDALQTLCLLLALCLIIWEIGNSMNMGLMEMTRQIIDNPHFRIFEFEDWHSKQNFWKQFLSGIFITIVMTGLDQDMMQKNLSCKSLKDAQKNMFSYGFAFIPVNLLFLSLGVLLMTFASQRGIAIPTNTDEMLPLLATQYMGSAVLFCFCIGIIAAAFSSADSALTALTTSFCIDILNIKKYDAEKGVRIRKNAYIFICIVFVLIILAIDLLNNKSILDAIYIIAGYTYGPLLGLFAFGLFTKIKAYNAWIPAIAILSPLLCYGVDRFVFYNWGYRFGYEMLMINGLFTFLGLFGSGIFRMVMDKKRG